MFSIPVGTDIALRLYEDRHAPEAFAIMDANRAYLRQWLGWLDDSTDVESTKKFIRTAQEQWSKNNGFQAGIWLIGAGANGADRLVGGIGLHYMNWLSRRTEIGYWVSQDLAGRGIMTRCVAAVCDGLFDVYHLNRIEIQAAVGNTASRRVPEKLGFHQDGILRQAGWLYDHFVDHAVYSMLASEWRAKRKSQ